MPRRRRYDPDRVPERVELHLHRQDRELLDQLVEATGLSRAEVIGLGLRALVADELAPRAPGSSMEDLIGAFGDASDIPIDLSDRHDTYQARALERSSGGRSEA